MHDTIDPADEATWLLLVHQLPPKPDYFRVKVGRRLQRVGAVPIKNSVYALPDREEAREDLEWVVRDIRQAGGEAMVGRVQLVTGLTDRDVRELFRRARGGEYEAVAAEAVERLRGLGEGPLGAEKAAEGERAAARLRRRIAAIRSIDFFASKERAEAEAAVTALQRRARGSARPTKRRGGGAASKRGKGRTWVTRRGVKVDRIGSAWLIRRFIDPDARFRFVDPATHRPKAGELRFDMYEGEYTHEGEDCTFETLLRRHRLEDPALRQIAEVVHDVDCKDGKFGREEAPGLALLVAGIVAARDRDQERIERGAALFDDLYAAFAPSRRRR